MKKVVFRMRIRPGTPELVESAELVAEIDLRDLGGRVPSWVERGRFSEVSGLVLAGIERALAGRRDDLLAGLELAFEEIGDVEELGGLAPGVRGRIVPGPGIAEVEFESVELEEEEES